MSDDKLGETPTDATHVERIHTDTDDLVREGAELVGLDPTKTEIVSASIRDDGCLELVLEGPRTKVQP